jgi:predicted nucleotidyltransferase component of viral defense system
LRQPAVVTRSLLAEILAHTQVSLRPEARSRFTPPAIPAPALEESLAEKLAAWRRRRKLRDLYDLDLFGRGALDEAQIRRLLVLKVWHDVVRSRYAFLTALDDAERRVARCNPGDRYEVSQLVLASIRADCC